MIPNDKIYKNIKFKHRLGFLKNLKHGVKKKLKIINYSK